MKGRKENNYIQSCFPDLQHVTLAQWCWVTGNLLHFSLTGQFYNISKTILFHTVHHECCYTVYCSLFPLFALFMTYYHQMARKYLSNVF